MKKSSGHWQRPAVPAVLVLCLSDIGRGQSRKAIMLLPCWKRFVWGWRPYPVTDSRLLLAGLRQAGAYLEAHNLTLPLRLAAELSRVLKTVQYYERALRGAVLGLYRGEIDGIEFVGEMIRLIEEQFRRAWNE